MKKWGIKGRVMFLALMPAAVIAALLAFYFTRSRIDDLEQSLYDRGFAVARQLAPASEYGVFSGNREILQALADSAAREADVTAVSIADSAGKLLAVSGRPLHSFDAHGKGSGPGTAMAAKGNSLIFSAPVYFSETEVEDYFLGAADTDGARSRHAGGRKILGRVTVELSRASTLARKNQLLLNSLAITLLGLGASAFLALRMSRGVTRPIHRLAHVVEDIGAGALDVRADTCAGGELQTLENGINAMAEALKSAHDKMQEKILEATALLSYQATHDTLTGLVNRHEFDVRLERAVLGAKEQDRVHALCYMDLDQFKIVNDTCGHSAGDELLRQIALLLHSHVRERDTLARLGGDEFGLLLENCALDKAQAISEAVRQSVQDYRFIWQDKSFVIGASFGLVAVTQDSDSAASLLSTADAACYAAKDKGRNRVHVHQPGDGELARRHGEMHWVSRITRALEEDRFRLYYQAIVPLGQGGLPGTHFEVLLRMLDEERKEIIPPMAFIPAAERYNLMQGIDRWVIRNSFAMHGRIFSRRKGGDTCTINLSGASLCDEHFLGFAREQLALFEVDPQTICFEVTETAAIVNLSSAVELMRELKKTGCRFSLDDFGSGLSSFTYLKNMPVDYLKIDGVFVKNMVHDSIDFAMVQAINDVGHVMGLKTIAEFVENETTLDKLGIVGVDYVQGHLLGQPRPITELIGP